jgi:hypothetical protein
MNAMIGRKKIGVLTFHRCINYGAYWQASPARHPIRLRDADGSFDQGAEPDDERGG